MSSLDIKNSDVNFQDAKDEGETQADSQAYSFRSSFLELLLKDYERLEEIKKPSKRLN